MQDRPDITGAD